MMVISKEVIGDVLEKHKTKGIHNYAVTDAIKLRPWNLATKVVDSKHYSKEYLHSGDTWESEDIDLAKYYQHVTKETGILVVDAIDSAKRKELISELSQRLFKTPIGAVVSYFLDKQGNSLVEEYTRVEGNAWARTYTYSEFEENRENDGRWMPSGIRQMVANYLGVNVNDEFHSAVDKAIKIWRGIA